MVLAIPSSRISHCGTSTRERQVLTRYTPASACCDAAPAGTIAARNTCFWGCVAGGHLRIRPGAADGAMASEDIVATLPLTVPWRGGTCEFQLRRAIPGAHGLARRHQRRLSLVADQFGNS